MVDWRLSEKGKVWVKHLLCNLSHELFEETATVYALLCDVVLVDKIDPYAVLDPLSQMIDLIVSVLHNIVTSDLNSLPMKESKHTLMLPHFSFLGYHSPKD